jgi:hypothetical protein
MGGRYVLDGSATGNRTQTHQSFTYSLWHGIDPMNTVPCISVEERDALVWGGGGSGVTAEVTIRSPISCEVQDT